MNHVPCGEIVASRYLRSSGGTPAKHSAFSEQGWSSSSMNGTIDATSTQQAFICGIHNGINRQCRNVVSDDFDATHRLCLRHTASLARGGGRFNREGG